MAKKKKQNQRKKFRSLILLLFLTVVMFSTATYAWFTANQTVTVSSLDVNVEASNGLQISADATNWKTIISNADLTQGYTGSTNMLPAQVSAVSTDGQVDTTTGHLNMYKGDVGADDTTGDYNITATKSTEASGSTGDFIAFDLFLKVDQDKEIYLTTSSKVTAKEGTDDKGLKNTARVGFVTLGTGTSDSSVTTLQGLNNAISSKAIIWEPNADTHTSYGTAEGTLYGIDTTGATTTYYGLTQAIGTAIPLKDALTGTNTTYTTQVTPNLSTAADYTQSQVIFSLKAGVTKIRVYMWIEGQDIDCENNASGTDISYTLQFSISKDA